MEWVCIGMGFPITLPLNAIYIKPVPTTSITFIFKKRERAEDESCPA
jgi:hypothetical protein